MLKILCSKWSSGAIVHVVQVILLKPTGQTPMMAFVAEFDFELFYFPIEYIKYMYISISWYVLSKSLL